jgi:hypothetical protein
MPTTTAKLLDSPYPSYAIYPSNNASSLYSSDYNATELNNIKWGVTSVLTKAPIINNQHEIIVGTRRYSYEQTYLRIYHSNGTEKCNKALGYFGASEMNTPAINDAGIIYFGVNRGGYTYGYIYGINNNCTQIYYRVIAAHIVSISHTKIGYYDDHIYMFDENGLLYAFNEDLSTNWTYQTEGENFYAPISIGTNGNIYISRTTNADRSVFYLYSITSTGTTTYTQSIYEAVCCHSAYDSGQNALDPNNNRAIWGGGNAILVFSPTGSYEFGDQLGAYESYGETSIKNDIYYFMGHDFWGVNSLADTVVHMPHITNYDAPSLLIGSNDIVYFIAQKYGTTQPYLFEMYLNGTIKSESSTSIPASTKLAFDSDGKMYGVGGGYLMSFDKPDPGEPVIYSISGYTKLTDIDNITYILASTMIRLNSSINTMSNASGFYKFSNLTTGVYNMNATKGFAYNSKEEMVNFIQTNVTVNFTLNYSKPSMSTPTIDGQSLKSIYSHSFKNITLWDNPYFVWGNYVYTNTTTKKECLYKGNNIFACDLLPGKYKFNMSYSDIYNYNLYLYHPTLTFNRTFYTNYIYIGSDSLSYNNTFKLNAKTREVTLSNKIYDYIFVIIIMIGIIYIVGFNKKRRSLKVYER